MVAINLAILLPLLPLLGMASAGSHALAHQRHRRHSGLVPVHQGARQAARDNVGHAEAHKVVKKNVKKRTKTCRKKDSSFTASATSTDSADSYVATSTSSIDGQAAWAKGGKKSSSTASWVTTTTSSADSWDVTTTSSSDWSQTTSSAASASTGGSSSGGNSGGLLTVNDPTCGYCNSDSDNPNGQETWINCGINSGGWTPPKVTVDELVAATLTASGPFSACAQYIDEMTSVANQYGIPPILIASIAMQESGCNSGATGGNGEAGLMQLASENCGGAPGGNCYDISFNIEGGAKVFKNYYDAAGSSFFEAMGQYNGWTVGMTVADATAAASEGDCTAQNNLDYLTQVVNGWMQGKDGTTLGSYFNLAAC